MILKKMKKTILRCIWLLGYWSVALKVNLLHFLFQSQYVLILTDTVEIDFQRVTKEDGPFYSVYLEDGHRIIIPLTLRKTGMIYHRKEKVYRLIPLTKELVQRQVSSPHVSEEECFFLDESCEDGNPLRGVFFGCLFLLPVYFVMSLLVWLYFL